MPRIAEFHNIPHAAPVCCKRSRRLLLRGVAAMACAVVGDRNRMNGYDHCEDLRA
jgi:hypothetical protein